MIRVSGRKEDGRTYPHAVIDGYTTHDSRVHLEWLEATDLLVVAIEPDDSKQLPTRRTAIPLTDLEAAITQLKALKR